MANKMLIDASHEEETRVVVVKGNRVEEFDFESEHKKQLKGNIYLAKVTRVEPSLQAAFVDYGGNRHGFLAFSEIHPDYYQIPKADRQALQEEELARAAEEDEDAEPAKPARGRRRRGTSRKSASSDDESVSESVEDANGDDAVDAAAEADEGEDSERQDGHSGPDEQEEVHTIGGDGSEETEEERPRRRRRSQSRSGDSGAETAPGENGDGDDRSNGGEESVDRIGAEDALEELPVRQVRSRRQYKIQEVIKRRQIILVQVVKEERGNKGAALTTYLSLAGRYSVLMPNTARGGGISRKITNATDRKRLKDVVKGLEVPRGMGIILRTAGANRTKAEVKRDYEYLMRLWETVRTVTLSSIAPALVYEEGSLIKRSIRDLYNKDIDQVLVSGEDGYREAKDFMRMLMPSQAKTVQPYREATPIFARQGIEAQLEKLVHPNVTLKSGGYVTINQTEALVAIDVNSGRSTKEHSIEDTAYQTNLEAAEEIARQLRLRDLAGLIVIDFIDMEEKRNNRSVEKKLKDCLKDDRARIQLGAISHFGLLEMSRQRIRASVLESTMQPCPHCEGAGYVRSSSSSALHVLRSIEDHLQKHSRHDLHVKVTTETALYLLNEKRKRIDELERFHGLRILIEANPNASIHAIEIVHGAEAAGNGLVEALEVTDDFAAIDAAERAADENALREAEKLASTDPEQASEAPRESRSSSDEEEDGNGGRRRRRRRRRGKADTAEIGEAAASEDPTAVSGEDEEVRETSDSQDDEEERSRKRRRRGRRGGRRNRDKTGRAGDATEANDFDASATEDREYGSSAGTRSRSIEIVELDERDIRSDAPDRPDDAREDVPEDDAATPSPVVADVPVVEPPEATLDATPAESDAELVSQEPEPEAAHSEEAETVRIEEAETVGSEAAPDISSEDTVPQAAAQPDTQEDARPVLDTPVVTSAAPEEAKPRRTGWWSRRSAG